MGLCHARNRNQSTSIHRRSTAYKDCHKQDSMANQLLRTTDRPQHQGCHMRRQALSYLRGMV